MPNVRIYSNDHWLPAGGVPSSRQHACLGNLIVALPGLVAEALQKVEGQTIKASEVAVMPLPLHPWAQHCAEVEIEVEPGEISTRDARAAVAHVLKDSILQFLEKTNLPYYPAFTVSCQPRPSSGIIVDRDGTVVQSWGS